jgi:hypothetical protein
MQFMVNDHDKQDFLYKRDRTIRFQMERFSRTTEEGWPYLAPELQLLHKAKSLRPKDQIDFENCLTKLNEKSLIWFKDMLIRCYSPEHPWLRAVRSI